MKKLSKSDYVFNKDVKSNIELQSRENDKPFYWDISNPIFIPKRKKFKR